MSKNNTKGYPLVGDGVEFLSGGGGRGGGGAFGPPPPNTRLDKLVLESID